MPAKRISELPPYVFATMDKKIQQARKQGRRIIDLSMSDPDRPPDESLYQALREDIARPDNHLYQSFEGKLELREAVAQWYRQRFSAEVEPAEVYITGGSKEALAHLALAFLDPGEVGLIPDPAYPAYRSGVILAGGEPYSLALRPGNNFRPVLGSIPSAVLQRARILYLNYPNNPTGAVADHDFLTQVVDFARQHNLILVYDHAYAEVTYDGQRAESPLAIPGAKEVVIESFTFSKAFHLQGWRLGGLIGSRENLAAFSQVESNIMAGVFRPIQAAGVRALQEAAGRPDFFASEARVFQDRRDLALEELGKLGYRLPKPKGAVYLWFPTPRGYDAAEFVDLALAKVGVALAPGTGFGPGGADHVRLSLTQPTAELRAGLEALATLWAQERLEAPRQPVLV